MNKKILATVVICFGLVVWGFGLDLHETARWLFALPK